jgi:hypothetical protein
MAWTEEQLRRELVNYTGSETCELCGNPEPLMFDECEVCGPMLLCQRCGNAHLDSLFTDRGFQSHLPN